MPCAYCDADVDGGCTSAAGSSDCLLGQLRAAEASARDWRVEYKQARREKNEAAAENTRLTERLEDKTRSLRVEIAAKQGAHNEIKMLEEERDAALREAESLAAALYRIHWREKAPNWKPLSGDLVGIITQIDNMTAGLIKPAERDAALARVERLETALRQVIEDNRIAWPAETRAVRMAETARSALSPATEEAKP